VPADQREKQLEFLKILYKPKQRLRTDDKALIKRILSLEQGFDGTEGKCFYCSEVSKIDGELTVHHRDGIISHNELGNLSIAHGSCNTSEWNRQRRATKKSVIGLSDQNRERKNIPPIHAQAHGDADIGWSAREGEKHDEMRYRWGRWIHDLEAGPFRGIGGAIRRSLLAEKAVYGCSQDEEPFGNSQTYSRYIKEDTAAGIFESWKEGAIWMVRYLGPRKDQHSLR
jgi:hypothetical protein